MEPFQSADTIDLPTAKVLHFLNYLRDKNPKVGIIPDPVVSPTAFPESMDDGRISIAFYTDDLPAGLLKPVVQNLGEALHDILHHPIAGRDTPSQSAIMPSLFELFVTPADLDKLAAYSGFDGKIPEASVLWTHALPMPRPQPKPEARRGFPGFLDFILQRGSQAQKPGAQPRPDNDELSVYPERFASLMVALRCLGMFKDDDLIEVAHDETDYGPDRGIVVIFDGEDLDAKQYRQLLALFRSMAPQDAEITTFDYDYSDDGEDYTAVGIYFDPEATAAIGDMVARNPYFSQNDKHDSKTHPVQYNERAEGTNLVDLMNDHEAWIEELQKPKKKR